MLQCAIRGPSVTRVHGKSAHQELLQQPTTLQLCHAHIVGKRAPKAVAHNDLLNGFKGSELLVPWFGLLVLVALELGASLQSVLHPDVLLNKTCPACGSCHGHV